MIKNGLIKRKKEMEILNKFYSIEEGALITITGRRKVGKTTFIQSFLKEKEEEHNFLNEKMFLFKFMANNSFNSQQNLQSALQDLKIQIFKYDELKNIKIKAVRNWGDFFSYIALINEYCLSNNIYLNLVFDEAAWYSKKNDFLNYFSNCFNNYILHNQKAKVFISSSTGSWIRFNILENKGSLYKREFLKPIHLNPFSFEEIFAYCQYKNPLIKKELIFEYYLMFGGIVKYYQIIDLNKPFESNIDFIQNEKQLFLNERKILLESLYQKHFILIAENILKILSRKKIANIKEIEEELKKIKLNRNIKTKLEEEFLERYLEGEKNNEICLKKINLHLLCDDLVESGLLKSVNKEGNKTKNKNYILNDLFAFFEYYWEKKSFNFGNDYNNWKGNAFEIFIFNHFEEVCQKLNIPFLKENIILNWKNKKDESQIDILYKINSRKQDIYYIVECKNLEKNHYLDQQQINSIRNKCYSLLEEKSLKNNNVLINVILISYDWLKLPEKQIEFPCFYLNFKNDF